MIFGCGDDTKNGAENLRRKLYSDENPTAKTQSTTPPGYCETSQSVVFGYREFREHISSDSYFNSIQICRIYFRNVPSKFNIDMSAFFAFLVKADVFAHVHA